MRLVCFRPHGFVIADDQRAKNEIEHEVLPEVCVFIPFLCISPAQVSPSEDADEDSRVF